MTFENFQYLHLLEKLRKVYRNGSLAKSWGSHSGTKEPFWYTFGKFGWLRICILCSGSGVEFIKKSVAHTIVATNANFKAKEPFWYTFQLFTKNCTRMAPWLKNQIFEGSHSGTHIWEGGSHSGTQEPFWYSLFLEEVLTLRSIFGTLWGNWWHFLVLYSCPV